MTLAARTTRLALLLVAVVVAFVDARTCATAQESRSASDSRDASGSTTDGWCIVCDAPAPEHARTELYKGRRVTVCDDRCAATFRADPERYFQQKEARGALFDEHAPANQTPESRSLVSGWMWFGLYVVAGLLCGAIAAYVALGKGIAPLPWLFAGLAFNVVALGLVVAKPRGDLSKLPEGVPAGLRKIPATYSPVRCARCGGENHPSARACSNCGAPLEARVESETARVRSTESPRRRPNEERS